MKVLFFDDRIKTETISKLIDNIEKAEDKEVIIYFTTGGEISILLKY